MAGIIESKGGRQTVANRALGEYQRTFDRQLVKGMEKYQKILHTYNGRDPGRDAWEELVDLSVYLEQLRMEHQAYGEILAYLFATADGGISLPEAIEERLVEVLQQVGKEQIQRKWGLHD